MVAEMKWDDADECYVSLALGQARDSFLRIDRQFTGPELVMEAIKTTIDIDGRFVAATPEGPKRLKAQRWAAGFIQRRKLRKFSNRECLTLLTANLLKRSSALTSKRRQTSF